MKVYTYTVDHDFGFAPNPFHGFCTLANCKPKIRARACVGDIILGIGGSRTGYSGRLIYWMKVGEIFSFDDFWLDGRFQIKKPVSNGSWMQVYGDHIYHTDQTSGQIIQTQNSFHSDPENRNIKRDTGTTSNVLISREYTYYGRRAPVLPTSLAMFAAWSRSYRCMFEPKDVDNLILWIHNEGVQKVAGRPIDWKPIERPPRI
jgi:Nucleotide modification associated domain 2